MSRLIVWSCGGADIGNPRSSRGLIIGTSELSVLKQSSCLRFGSENVKLWAELSKI